MDDSVKIPPIEEKSEEQQKYEDYLNKEVYPLFKVEFEDTHYQRDVDSDIWLDSDMVDLVRTGRKAILYVKRKYGMDWEILYDGLSKDLVEASVQIREIKEQYQHWVWSYIDKPPVMFVYQNQVFKQPYVMFDQLCIAGIPIEPEKYYTDEGSVKVSFFKSYVRPIPENTILIHAEQVYYNGELLYSRSELRLLNVKTYSTTEILNHIRLNNSIPKGTPYEADWESGQL